MCPSLDRGMWGMASFVCMKAYGQSMPLSARKISLQAASTRVWRWAWWEWAQMAGRLKICLHPMARLGTTNTNAICHWGFSVFPQAPAWERMVNCACMIAHTWNHIITEQQSTKPHVAFVDASHRPTSPERSMKSLMLSLSAMEEKEQVSQQAVISKCLGETLAVMHRCLPPATSVVCLWKVSRCRLSCEGWFNLTLPSSILLYEFYIKAGSMCLKICYCNLYLMWLVLLLLCGHKWDGPFYENSFHAINHDE